MRPAELHSRSAEENCSTENVASLRSVKVATPPCAAKAAIPCGLAVRKQHEMLFAASKFDINKSIFVKEIYNMKKVCLAVLPALTIVLELLPLGAVCIFATSPTERVKETFSYFSLTPFGYANFAPLITATLNCCHLLTFIVFIEEERCSQSIVCPFHYYGSYFSFAIDVWLKLLYPCRSPYNSNTCNRKYFG